MNFCTRTGAGAAVSKQWRCAFTLHPPPLYKVEAGQPSVGPTPEYSFMNKGFRWWFTSMR